MKDGLTMEQRAAVLRSCRSTLGNMDREREILEKRRENGDKDAETLLSILKYEHDTLAGAVRELWSNHRSKPP